MPKDPTPENKSKIYDFEKSISNLFECLIILKIDSFVRSLRGLVLLSLFQNFSFKRSRYNSFLNNL